MRQQRRSAPARADFPAIPEGASLLINTNEGFLVSSMVEGEIAFRIPQCARPMAGFTTAKSSPTGPERTWGEGGDKAREIRTVKIS
jgi:hypothetical protein